MEPQTSPRSSALSIRTVPLDSLHQDPSNVRMHDARNLEAITASLKRFGQAEPLVVQQRTGRVIGGNGRLQAMKQLGWTSCEIVELDVDDLQATSLCIALNRTGELAGWDEPALAKLLEQLRAEDALDGVGYSTDDIDALVQHLRAEEASGDLDDDVADEPPAIAVSRLGDLWHLGEHRVACGDATKAPEVNRLLAGTTPFLMVADPPYGVSYDPEWRHEAGLNDSDSIGKVRNDDRVDWTAAYQLFPGDVAYVWHAGRFAGEVAQNLAAAGFGIRAQIVWRKPAFAISRGHYHWQHEPCWYAVREGQTAKWVGDRSQSTIWDISNKIQDHTEHSTQKPLECMARPIMNHGSLQDAVYDPFLGSGTTLIAAEKLGRRCFGLEIDPRYCDVIVGRWRKATGREATLDGKTFAEVAAERGVAP